jgi:hypothetical protein
MPDLAVQSRPVGSSSGYVPVSIGTPIYHDADRRLGSLVAASWPLRRRQRELELELERRGSSCHSRELVLARAMPVT